MSFLGMGRAQPTSEQKIAAVEGEMRMMADTYNRYVIPLSQSQIATLQDSQSQSSITQRLNANTP